MYNGLYLTSYFNNSHRTLSPGNWPEVKEKVMLLNIFTLI